MNAVAVCQFCLTLHDVCFQTFCIQGELLHELSLYFLAKLLEIRYRHIRSFGKEALDRLNVERSLNNAFHH